MRILRIKRIQRIKPAVEQASSRIHFLSGELQLPSGRRGSVGGGAVPLFSSSAEIRNIRQIRVVQNRSLWGQLAVQRSVSVHPAYATPARLARTRKGAALSGQPLVFVRAE